MLLSMHFLQLHALYHWSCAWLAKHTIIKRCFDNSVAPGHPLQLLASSARQTHLLLILMGVLKMYIKAHRLIIIVIY